MLGIAAIVLAFLCLMSYIAKNLNLYWLFESTIKQMVES